MADTDAAGEAQVAQIYRYTKPEIIEGRGKAIQILGRTDHAIFAVQLISRGGENNLHSHANLDGFWTVLKGRCRFYTTDDELIADLGPMEGIIIPRNYPYWFEAAGDEELELMQFETTTTGWGTGDHPEMGRTDLAPRRAWQEPRPGAPVASN